MTKYLVLEVYDDVEGESECSYAGVAITPEMARKYLRLIHHARQINIEQPEGFIFSSLKFYDMTPYWLDDSFGLDAFDGFDNEMRLLDKEQFEVIEGLDSDSIYRMDAQMVRVTENDISWTAQSHYGRASFETESIQKETLEEIAKEEA